MRRKNGSGCESLASQGGVRGHAEWLWRSVTFLEDLCPPITVVLKTLGNLICLSFMCISPLRQVVSAVLFRLQSFDGVYSISYLFPPATVSMCPLGPEEMVQCIKGLLSRHEDLSSDPQF